MSRLGWYCVLLRHYRALLVMIYTARCCRCIFGAGCLADDFRKINAEQQTGEGVVRLPSYIQLLLLMPVSLLLVSLTSSPIGIRHERHLQSSS